MTPEDRLTMAIQVFFQETKRRRALPDDLSVPRYRHWTGSELQPIDCYKYQVEYGDGVREEAEHVRREDTTLEVLLGVLDFAFDKELKVLRVRRKREK